MKKPTKRKKLRFSQEVKNKLVSMMSCMKNMKKKKPWLFMN